MRRNKIYIIFILIIILFALISYFYLFNIYEVIYSVNPEELYADNKSSVTITSQPINALGYKSPFRSAPCEFIIKEGGKLVNVILKEDDKGILKLNAKDKTGMVIVYIKSKYALFPSLIEIHIYPIYPGITSK